MKHSVILSLTVFLSAMLLVFRPWFTLGEIIGGDWPYYFSDTLAYFSITPRLWGPWLANGLGGVHPILGLHFFSSLIIVPFTQWLHIPWTIAYKIGWFGLFLFLSAFSSHRLSRLVIWNSSPFVYYFSSLIYTTNTYILMVTSGGQMGVALAYAASPLVFASFLNRSALQLGLFLGLQLMIDPRIAYVTTVGIGLYYVLFPRELRSGFLTLCASAIIAVGVNAFWLVPFVVLKSDPLAGLGTAFASIESVKFFSFADFSHALSLLHPNWPENIFGKTYFLQPEFLVLPILAFSSLLYTKKIIFYFAFLALTGAFLAKGANEPFSGVYVWLFTHVPGFAMFRDPSKFYLLVSVGLSVLTPFALRAFGRYKTHAFVAAAIIWFFLIREGMMGHLGGTFATRALPREYRDLAVLLQNDPSFSRTLWVPRQSRFAFATLDHMAVEAEPFLSATNPAQLAQKLEDPSARELVSDIGVGRVILPFDVLGELFVSDRTYDAKKRRAYEEVLDRVPWLTNVQSGNLAIYETHSHRDLFSTSTDELVGYSRIRLDAYRVSVQTRSSSKLLFSQRYYPGWVFRPAASRIEARSLPNGLMAFDLPSAGSYNGEVVFEPQRLVTVGAVASLLTIGVIVLRFFLYNGGV